MHSEADIYNPVVSGAKAGKEKDAARKRYRDALNRLKENPTNADLKRQTLALGRAYSNLTRDKKGNALFAMCGLPWPDKKKRMRPKGASALQLCCLLPSHRSREINVVPIHPGYWRYVNNDSAIDLAPASFLSNTPG
jgi:hypothetical protein